MVRPELDGHSDLVVDATGVGVPVVDQLRQAGLSPIPVTITSGRRVKCVAGNWRVPKRALVGALIAALESGRLKVARGLPCGDALMCELRDFRVRITSHRHAAFGGAAEHDDLVLAVALAVWRAIEAS